jgi:FlaA1/EpsC-like NDP-sugar epimerase
VTPRLEQLLQRESIRFDAGQLRPQIEGTSLLVTGAGGSIGSALSRRLLELSPARLIALDSSEQNLHELLLELSDDPRASALVPVLADLRQTELIENVVGSHRPHVVFHTAAFKQVPLLERQPLAAVQNNLIVTRDLLRAARRHAVRRFVMTSTDKAVLPRSILGATKRLAELVLLALDDSVLGATSVRLCNVWGSRGSVVERFRAQIENGKPVTVTCAEATRMFMSEQEAVAVTLAALELCRGRDLLIPTVAETLSILEVAERFIQSTERPVQHEPIRFTGPRPGDKLTERLVHPDEQTEATGHHALQRVVAPLPGAAEIERGIGQIEARLLQQDPAGVVERIRAMLPEYRPSDTLLEQCGISVAG